MTKNLDDKINAQELERIPRSIFATGSSRIQAAKRLLRDKYEELKRSYSQRNLYSNNEKGSAQQYAGS